MTLCIKTVCNLNLSCVHSECNYNFCAIADLYTSSLNTIRAEYPGNSVYNNLVYVSTYTHIHVQACIGMLSVYSDMDHVLITTTPDVCVMQLAYTN